MFEIVDDDDGRTTGQSTDGGTMDAGQWVYYKLIYEPLAKIIIFKKMKTFTSKTILCCPT